MQCPITHLAILLVFYQLMALERDEIFPSNLETEF